VRVYADVIGINLFEQRLIRRIEYHIAGLGFWAELLTIVSKLDQDVDRIGIGIDSQLAKTVAIPVSLSFWHIVGLFSSVSLGIIHMQYVGPR
jgi:hypothetical protein